MSIGTEMVLYHARGSSPVLAARPKLFCITFDSIGASKAVVSDSLTSAKILSSTAKLTQSDRRRFLKCLSGYPPKRDSELPTEMCPHGVRDNRAGRDDVYSVISREAVD
nr:hypothetical protein CFP56_11734 [Quercus suber]